MRLSRVWKVGNHVDDNHQKAIELATRHLPLVLPDVVKVDADCRLQHNGLAKLQARPPLVLCGLELAEQSGDLVEYVHIVTKVPAVVRAVKIIFFHQS